MSLIDNFRYWSKLHRLLPSLLGFFVAPTASAQGSLLAQLSSLGWNWDPWILTSLTLASLGYSCGLSRVNKTLRRRSFGWMRTLSFGAGIAALFLALLSPFDALDDQLFSAHMVQHLILLMVAPPLLISGRPALVTLWAFPLAWRRGISRLWSRTGLRRLAHWLMAPIFVWMLCSSILWFWHLPGPYGWALESEYVHALEHICFFLSSLMFWSVVLEPLGRRRLDYGSTLLFVATFGLQNGLLGALLIFSGRPLYGAYLPTTAAWGLTPLDDQQLAGLIMWIPASLIHLTTLFVLFVAWMRTAERRAVLAAGHRSRTPFRAEST